MRLKLVTPFLGSVLAVAALAAAAGQHPLKVAHPPDPAMVHDASDPSLVSEPDRALSCGNPCRTVGNVMRVANSFFEGTISCDTGRWTVGMESTHPASGGVAQDVLWGGSAMDTRYGEVRFHVYTPTALEYSNPATSGSGSGVCAFDPADTSLEVSSTGLEREVTVSPAGGPSLLLRQELVVFGATAADAGVRLTLSITNRASSTVPAKVGMRWFLDFMMVGDDGPAWAPVVCSPFSVGSELMVEHEIAPAEIQQFFRERNNAGAPEVQLYASTSAVTGHAGTFRPDRMVHGRWGNLVPSSGPPASPWDVVVTENDGTDDDSVVFAYAGFPDTAGFTIAPGESISRSVVILDSCDQQSACTVPAGTVDNALLGVKAGANSAFSWLAATLAPPDARLFRTALKTELPETPTGIGDETVIVTTITRMATDNPATPSPVYFYKVLPVDGCGVTVFP